jgi:signal transduction histidine kinase
MKNNRVGVVLIVFSLAMITLVVWLMLQRQHVTPGGLPTLKDLPFVGLLALAMFVPLPLACFLSRRELAPLSAIGAQLDQVVANGGIAGLRTIAPRDVRELAGQLRSCLDGATMRIADLEKDRFKVIADGRLLEYGSNKMHAVLHCMPDGLLILDPSGEITFANGKIEHLLGASYDDVLSTPIESWCQDGELKALLGRYRSDSTEAGRQAGVEFSPRAVPHKRLIATAQPLVGAQGQMAFGTLVVLRDASREYLALQAGNDFVAHVSHELKSPLNVISMYAETLQDAPPDDQETRVLSINVIQDEVERMSSLVNNLLNVSKLETGSMNAQRNRIKLDDLLRDAFNQALPRAESRNIKIDLQVPRELAAVSIDKDLFRIALNNLMTNAIKYNRDGGDVALIAEEGETDIVITVRDSGIGIAAEAQAHVFEKFYRAPDGESISRGGHGLGLYLTSQIVELHHGRMSLESEVGRGSAFSIHLNKMPPLMQGGNVL